MKVIFGALIALAASVGVQAAVTGSQACSSALCVTGRHDSSTNQDTYTLSPPSGTSIPQSNFGWMAIGFGTRMSDAAMIVVWPNSDGSITLSQRTAPGHVLPTVDSSSLRSASLNTAASFSNSSNTAITFTVPSNSDSTGSAVNLIWAYGSRNPGSSSPNAAFSRHDDFGTMQLALMTSLASTSSSSGSVSGTSTGSASPATTSGISSGGSTSSAAGVGAGGLSGMALTAHIVCGALATMAFFPIGALIPRWSRAFSASRAWFPAHAAINGLIGTGLVIAAFAIGASQFSNGFITKHRKLGLTLLILCLVQVVLGITAHYVKFSIVKHPSGRGVSHFAHIILGIAVLVIGFITVWTGMDDEYPAWTVYGPVSTGWKAGFGVIVGVFAVLYAVGLAVGLPRQIRREREQRNHSVSSSQGSSTPVDGLMKETSTRHQL